MIGRELQKRYDWLQAAIELPVRLDFCRITRSEKMSPLIWKVVAGDEPFIKAFIEPEIESSSIPLLIAISQTRQAAKARETKDLSALLDSGLKLDMYCIACGIVAEDALSKNDRHRVLPVNVIASGVGIAQEACREASVRPLMLWDRYINRCRAEWIWALQPYILEKTGGKCWYCGDKVVLGALAADKIIPGLQLTPAQKRRKFHVDHKIPRSRGGTDNFENLVPSCALCNASKGAKPLEEYREYVATKSLLGFSSLPNRHELIQSYRFWGEREKVLVTS